MKCVRDLPSSVEQLGEATFASWAMRFTFPRDDGCTSGLLIAERTVGIAMYSVPARSKANEYILTRTGTLTANQRSRRSGAS